MHHADPALTPAATLGPTFSDQWYRVANLHPRLHAHVQVQRHAYRGEIWHVLDDTVGGRQHRINPVAWSLVARLDGQQSLHQIWETVINEQGSQAPTQPEVLALLGQLHENGLIASEGRPDLKGLFTQHEQRSRRERLAQRNPLAFRVPLFNPAPWLARADGLAQALFNRPALWLWCALVLLALAGAATHAGELQAYGARHIGSPQQLLLLWLLYPVVKALHETAHALAVRRWGGTVSEVGLTLMLLLPVPYVDASAATAFRQRRHRIIVSLAGMAAEAALAALALGLWLLVSDGLIRDAAFVVMLIGGVSTLLFNGNPLVRMDAYHALADALESPGLAPRSKAYLLYLARRWLLGLSQARPPTVAPGERRWLLGYGLASTVYQWLLALWIVSWLLGVHLLLGSLAVAWFAIIMLALPARRLWRWTRTAAELAHNRQRALAAGGLLTVLPLLLVLAVPLPAYTRAQGVVWLPEKAVARAGAEGFVDQLLAQDGDAVEAGTPLLRLVDPSFDADVLALSARWRGVSAAQHMALFTQSPQAAVLTQQLEQLKAEFRRLKQRLEQLTVRAGASGRLVLPHAADLPGAWVSRGAVVAHVLPQHGSQVRVVVPQDDISRLQGHLDGAAVPPAQHDGAPNAGPVVQVRLASAPGVTQAAWVLAQTPAATRELPSPVLGDHGQGPFAIDPTDTEQRRTLEPVFTLDLSLPEAAQQRPGTRAWVRFDHGAQPLAWQWLHRVRQLFIGRLFTTA